LSMTTNVKQQLQEIDGLVKKESYGEASLLIEQLLELHPHEGWIWRKRAYINSHQGNLEAAIKDLSKAISICQIEPDFFYTRGILFFQDGRFRDAVADFTRVIELCDLLDSNYYREGAYFFRADSYVRLKEFKKARADCTRIRDGMSTWTDQLRSKAEILSECA
jgi:tetratricopeptide (TPR) repeat protein